jgi:hypothetical protein
MRDTTIEVKSGADARHGPNHGRPSRLGRTVGFLAILATAGTVLLAAPGTAQAATTPGPSASLTLAASSISAGTKPVVTFITANVPAGAVIYLQRAAASSGPWQNVGRLGVGSGTVRAPADAAGSYQYRILIAQGSTAVATSAASDLTVTGTSGGPADSAPSGEPGSGSCSSSCQVAATVVPLLAPVVEPVIVSVVQQIGSWVLAVLGAIFGL